MLREYTPGDTGKPTAHVEAPTRALFDSDMSPTEAKAIVTREDKDVSDLVRRGMIPASPEILNLLSKRQELVQRLLRLEAEQSKRKGFLKHDRSMLQAHRISDNLATTRAEIIEINAQIRALKEVDVLAAETLTKESERNIRIAAIAVARASAVHRHRNAALDAALQALKQVIPEWDDGLPIRERASRNAP